MLSWCRSVLIVATALLLAACENDSESPQPTASDSPGTEATQPKTVTSPTPSPVLLGRALAFVAADGSLWLLDESGLESQVFAPSNGFVFHPEWSPDGSRLAFTEVSYTGDPPNFNSIADVLAVVVVDMSGQQVARIQRAAIPHWSPDGRLLSILAEPDSNGAFSGAPAIVDIASGSIRMLASSLMTTDAPRWSSDGAELAYATFDIGLFLADATGEKAPQLIAPAQTGERFYISPVWSEHGEILAFERDRTVGDPNGVDSYVLINRDRGVVSRVPDSHPSKCGRELTFFDHEPIWLPGTSHVMWTVECQSPAGFWIKSMGGDGYERFVDVSAASESIRRLDVSPDGELALFSTSGPFLRWAPPLVSPGNEDRFRIYSVRLADGSVNQLLSESMEAAFRP